MQRKNSQTPRQRYQRVQAALQQQGRKRELLLLQTFCLKTTSIHVHIGSIPRKVAAINSNVVRDSEG